MKRIFNALLLSPTLAGALVLGLQRPAAAQLNIVIEYDDRSSDVPSWDSDGACLTHTVQAAADYWESLFPGVPALEVKIRFRWYDAWAHGSIGLTTDAMCKWADTRRRLGGVLTPNQYTMRFWTQTSAGPTDWFIDDDPTDHAEFDVTPRVYQWPYDAGTSTGMDGAVSNVLEVGFEGPARTSDLVTPSCGAVDAAHGVDLYTVALHEIGHALGLGNRGEHDANVDGDYDVYSPLHGMLGIETATTSSGGIDNAHLLADYALMNPGISDARRRLPSMIDVLAIADINGWTSFLFPRQLRKYSPPPYPWSNLLEWLGGLLPTASQGAVLYTDPSDVVSMSTAVTVDGLYIGELMQLDTGTHALDAGERVALAPASLLKVSGGSMTTELVVHHGQKLEVSSAGSLSLSQYLVADGASIVSIVGTTGSQAHLYGSLAYVHLMGSAQLLPSHTDILLARLDLDGAMTRLDGGYTQASGLLELNNDGLISANNGDLLFSPASSSVFFDLDGDQVPETGRVDAQGGSINFAAPAADSFAGTMLIGTGRTLTVATSLPVDGGTIEFSGDNSRLVSGNLDMISGAVDVSGPIGTDAFIQAPQTWRDLSRATLSLGNGLHLLGTSHYRGGTVSIGDGFVRQVGDAVVHVSPLPTRIEVLNYVWDGELPSGGGAAFSKTTVQPGAKLYITGGIGTGALDGYDGKIYLQAGAELYVERDWILEGELILQGGRVLAGGTITNTGSIHGNGTIETTVINNGDVHCDGGSILWCGSCYVAGTGTCGPAGCCP